MRKILDGVLWSVVAAFTLGAGVLFWVDLAIWSEARAAPPPAGCTKFQIDPQASTPLAVVALPPKTGCHVQWRNGFPIPDPACTPGAVNPTLTADILRDPGFTTKCVRNNLSSELEKHETYRWYNILVPRHNVGSSQVCELDHLVSLELGGSDALSNIWPQCGDASKPLDERFFKRKDAVENWLAKQVKEGKMDLAEAQKGIASDWTQYLDRVAATPAR